MTVCNLHILYNEKSLYRNMKISLMIKLSYQMGFIFLVNTFCYLFGENHTNVFYL